MAQLVEIAGVGTVEFPDGMSRDDMAAALRQLPTPNAAPTKQPVAAKATPAAVATAPKQEPAPAPVVDNIQNPFQAGVTVPKVTTAPNQLAVEEGVTKTPVLDKSLSLIEEGGKGIKSGVSTVKSIPTALGAFTDVGAALTNLNISSIYDKIDKGEITDAKQIQTGSDFEASRARMYLNSKPETRRVLRDKVTQEVSTRKEDVQAAVNILQQYQKENLVNKGRTEDLTDVESVTDFANWASYNLGTAGVQLVPIIVSAVATGGLGVFATGTAMELSGSVQNRLNYILDKTKDVQNPKDRANAVFDYVAKTGDVTLLSAIASGAVDVVLGPAADIIKKPAAQIIKEQTRKEIIKEIPKAVAKQGGEEFLAGGIQETIQIAAERALGEQTGDFATKENIKRIVNSAAAEAVGGAGFGGASKGLQAALAKPNTENTDTPEGRALRDLNSLADDEEDQIEAPPKTKRTLNNVTNAEISSIERKLYAELGRAPNDDELLEAMDEYISEQNAGITTESGTVGGGISGAGRTQDTGVSDTGDTTTSTTSGLAGTSGSTESSGSTEESKPLTLEEATQRHKEALDLMYGPHEEFTMAIQAYGEASESGDSQAESAALEELIKAEDKYDAAMAEVKRTANAMQGAKRANVKPAAKQETPAETKQETPAETKQEAPATDVAALEQVLNDRASEYQAIKNAQNALLTKAGRIPAKNSPARKKYDELERQRVDAEIKLREADANVNNAKRTATQTEGETVNEKRNVESYINDLEPYMKRYNRYINDATLGPIIQSANNAIQGLTDFVNGLGLYVNAINTGTKTPGAIAAKRLMSDIAGTASRLMTKQNAVDNENKRADTEKVNEAIAELQAIIDKAQSFIKEMKAESSEDSDKDSGGEEFFSLGKVVDSLSDSQVDLTLADAVPQNLSGITKINRLFNEGKISFFEYTREMNKLTENLAEQRRINAAKEANNQRGLGRVIQALESAAKQGKIAKEMADMAIWFLLKNPSMASDLAISISAPPTEYKGKGVDGIYNSLKRLVSIFTSIDPTTGKYEYDDPVTAVHEILHHLERMLPPGIRATIRNEWRTRLEAATLDAQKKLDSAVAQLNKLNKNKPEAATEVERLEEDIRKQQYILAYFATVAQANASQDFSLFKTATEMLVSGKVPVSLYSFINPSEFWAVTGSNIISGRYGVSKRNKFYQAMQYLKEFIQKIKEVFGLQSDAPIIRGLSEVLNGKGTFVTNSMLYRSENMVFPSLSENLRHGTSYGAAQNIIRDGRLAPDAGKRMYTYSQFGRKAVYLTSENGWWLDAAKAADARATSYEVSIPFKLDPKANIRVIESMEDLDALAKEVGFMDGAKMMRAFDVDNLDLQEFAKRAQNQTFEEFVQDAIIQRQEFDDSIVDLNSLVESSRAKELEYYGEATTTVESFLEEQRERHDYYKTFSDQYKNSDNLTQALLDLGVDGIYISPKTSETTQEERDEYDAIVDAVNDSIPFDQSQERLYLVGETIDKLVNEKNPTFLGRYFFPAAGDQLALFRPELAIVDRARLAGERPNNAPRFSIDDLSKRAGETINEYISRLANSPRSKLSQDVVEMLANNDLKGALLAVAARFKGIQSSSLYGQLAERLAELNLPTEVRINNQRNLTRKQIDLMSGSHQVRLFSLIRRALPSEFNTYFSNYSDESALEKVYAGLIQLGKHPNALNAIRAMRYEYDVVMEAFNAAMPGLDSLGTYYPLFDAINLNDTSGPSNGMNYHTFLHETVHAATEILLATPESQRTPEQNEAVKELEALFKLANDNIKTNEYGLTHLSEFVAEVFTNPKFRNMLRAIPYAPAKTNVLSRFIQSVMALIGLDNVAGRAMVEADKLFNNARPVTPISAGPRFSAPKKKRYRKGPLTSTWKSVEDVINSKMPWASALPHISNLIWNVVTGPARAKILGALELRHLSDLTKTKFPQINGAVRMIEKMIAHRGKIMTEAADIVKVWSKAQGKNAAQSTLLGRIMLEATISGVEVDPANVANYDATKVNQKVKDAWNTLDPEFQGIYRKVRDFYKKQVEDMVQSLVDQANTIQDPETRQKVLDSIANDFGPDKLVFPYFPLKRFGEHWFQVGRDDTFKEFYEFESYTAREIALLKRKVQLLSGNAKQQELARNIEKGNSISQLHKKFGDATDALRSVNELVDALSQQVTDANTGKTRDKTIDEAKSEIRDNLNQLIYTLLPQQSIRKMMINRKAVQGASSDMLRVFASSATRLAYQQARSKYSPLFLANLNNARSHINDMGETRTMDEKEVFRDFLNEVERRHKPMLGMEETNDVARVAGIASDAVTFMMMSAPMSAFLNTVGFAQFAATTLGGKYGYIKATDRLWGNFTKYMGSTVSRTLVPMATGQLFSVQFPSAMESGKLQGIDKLAAEQLIAEEQVNVSQTYDMVNVGDRPSELTLSKYEAIKRAVFAPLHQLERFNREMALLSGFQLEYEKLMSEPKKEPNGIVIRDASGNPEMYTNDATTPDGVPYSTEAYEAALGAAKDLAGITLGETTRQMRPRYFMDPLSSLVLKFKRYAITAFYALTRNFKLGFIVPFSNAEIDQMRKALEADKQPEAVIAQKIKEMKDFRKELATEGKKTLAGILGVTSLFTGAVGLPIASLVMPTLVGMMTDDDEDDEFFDWDNWFRNYMETEFGGYVSAMLVQMGMEKGAASKMGRTVGESIAIGPISSVTGGSFTERASLDMKSLLFRDLRYSPEARQTVMEAMIQALGPTGGLALQLADGIDLISKGQYERGMEKMLPAVISKPMSAARYAEEGAKTSRGDTIVDELTSTEIAMQSIGLTPKRVAEGQRQAIQAVQKQQKILARRNSIMDELWMAHSTGDSDAFQAAQEKQIAFSIRYPTQKITGKMVKDSFKKRREDQQAANRIGARINKKLTNELSPMLQYGDE